MKTVFSLERKLQIRCGVEEDEEVKGYLYGGKVEGARNEIMGFFKNKNFNLIYKVGNSSFMGKGFLQLM